MYLRLISLLIREQIYYVVIIKDTIVSIAARYVTLPEIHLIGGVFTREEYGGIGYAKAVISALTREAIISGALSSPHIEVCSVLNSVLSVVEILLLTVFIVGIDEMSRELRSQRSL